MTHLLFLLLLVFSMVVPSRAQTAEDTDFDGSGVVDVADSLASVNVIGQKATPQPDSVEGDRAALVELYNATNGPEWKDNTNWLSTKPIDQWFGVTTNAQGRVDSLSLSDNNLSGHLPASLGILTKLTELDLHANDLSGSIPPELGNLTKLTDLSLSRNALSGPIPASFENLTNLTHLYLYANNLSETIPANLVEGVEGDRAALVELYYATHGPKWTIKTNWLSTKPIDQWYGVTTNAQGRVDSLSLYYNNLSGHLPASLGILTNLTHLNLGYNFRLSGSIPPELGNLTNLTHLDLSDNAFSDLPPELSNLTNLTHLDLNDNNLSGSIPSELGKLTNLTHLDLNDNNLSGSIPSELGNLTNLTYLKLSYNNLSGSIPSELGNLTNLTHLNLNDNNLSKTIPTDLVEGVEGDRAALVELYYTTNGPEWKDKTNWLSTKPIDQWFGVTTNAQGRVVSLSLYYNNLSGHLPASLGILTNLTHLNLIGNDLSGSIPASLSNLINLTKLWLSANDLSGSIPPELEVYSKVVDE